jgi:hypothetical protein
VRTLDVALANIAAYANDLELVQSKRVRYGSPNGKGSVGKTVPMPIDNRFTDPTGDGSRLAWETKNTISAWARTALTTWPPASGPTCKSCLHPTCHDIKRRAHPRDTVTACVQYLAGHRHGIAAQEWAAELLDEILDLERRLRRFVDRPRDAWYAGICGSVTDTDHGEVQCKRQLFAEPGCPWVRCADCGCEYDVEARRKKLLEEAEDRTVTIRMLARIVTTLGAVDASERRLEGRISKWVQRDQLHARGRRVIDGKPRPVYRVGDVLTLLAEDAAAAAC